MDVSHSSESQQISEALNEHKFLTTGIQKGRCNTLKTHDKINKP